MNQGKIKGIKLPKPHDQEQLINESFADNTNSGDGRIEELW